MDQLDAQAEPGSEGRPERSPSTRIALGIGLSLALLLLIALAVRISFSRAYAVDEFAYAHAGWLIAQGAVPHLDFFETKFTGPLWLFSLVFAVGGDDPHLIQALRVLIWPFVAVVVVGAGLLNRRVHLLAPLVTALLLLANPVFTNTALEIRPDIVALAGLMAALGLVAHGGRSRTTGVVIGVLLGLCAWGSAKALIYASPVALAWAFERFVSIDEEDRLFHAPWAIVAGFAAVVAGVFFLLLATGSLDAFLAQAIHHNRQFLVGQRWRPWQPDVVFLLVNAAWLHVLALVELGSLVFVDDRDAARARRMTGVLALLLASTFASHALQLYPFLYSLLPFMALEAVFAGRGLVRMASWIAGWRQARSETRLHGRLEPARGAVAVALVGWAVIGVGTGAGLLYSVGAPSNQIQLALLDEIARVSQPGDAVYDNSGSYVARRNAYFLPWTDAPIRAIWAEKLVREVPLAIEASDCVVAVLDERFQSLPEELKLYLHSHFKPYARGVLLWGTDFGTEDGEVDGVFRANRSGRYRIFPPSVAAEGGLSVDGKAVEGEVVELVKGSHPVRYRGQAAGFRLQWMPGDARLAAR